MTFWGKIQLTIAINHAAWPTQCHWKTWISPWQRWGGTGVGGGVQCSLESFSQRRDAQKKNVFSRPVDHLSLFMFTVLLTPSNGGLGVGGGGCSFKGIIMLPRTWHCSVWLAWPHTALTDYRHTILLHCAASLWTPASMGLREQWPRGSRRSGGDKGRKPLSALWCPYRYLLYAKDIVHNLTLTHTHTHAIVLAVTNRIELRNVCTWKNIIKKICEWQSDSNICWSFFHLKQLSSLAAIIT